MYLKCVSPPRRVRRPAKAVTCKLLPPGPGAAPAGMLAMSTAPRPGVATHTHTAVTQNGVSDLALRCAHSCLGGEASHLSGPSWLPRLLFSFGSPGTLDLPSTFVPPLPLDAIRHARSSRRHPLLGLTLGALCFPPPAAWYAWCVLSSVGIEPSRATRRRPTTVVPPPQPRGNAMRASWVRPCPPDHPAVSALQL